MLKLNLDGFDKGVLAMANLDKLKQNWEHLYTQFKIQTGGTVVCMVHNQTRKHVYFDVQLQRFLSKQEAMMYRADVTGRHLIQL